MKRLLFVLAAFALAFASGAAAADDIRIGGTGAALGTMRLLARAFNASNPDVSVTILPSLGSGGGIKAMVDGAIGLAVSSRPPNARELKLGVVALEYARTPFVFAISVDSPVTAITSAELANAYAGTMAAWPDGNAVRLVLRPESDIDTRTIEGMSAEIRRALQAAQARPGVRFAVTDQEAASDLEKIPGAIGPSTLALIMSEKRTLRALILDGRKPTLRNAVSGAYPYFKRLYFVTGAAPPPAVRRFVAFVQSAAGRNILTRNGQWIP